jgi:hypothetical protein
MIPVRCPNCNEELEDELYYCIGCGVELDEAVRKNASAWGREKARLAEQVRRELEAEEKARASQASYASAGLPYQSTPERLPGMNLVYIYDPKVLPPRLMKGVIEAAQGARDVKRLYSMTSAGITVAECELEPIYVREYRNTAIYHIQYIETIRENEIQRNIVSVSVDYESNDPYAAYLTGATRDHMRSYQKETLKSDLGSWSSGSSKSLDEYFSKINGIASSDFLKRYFIKDGEK